MHDVVTTIDRIDANVDHRPVNRPRITHVLKHVGHGSGNVHVAVDLACVQADAGYDVSVVSGGGTFVELLHQHGVRHTVMTQEPARPFGILRSMLSFVRYCRSERPDIIHAHMTAAAIMGFFASRLTGIPMVTTVHNSFDPQSIFMRLGKKIVAVSHAERDHLIKKGCKPAAVEVVLNAPARSPRQDYMRNDRSITLGRPSVVVICGLHRRKGVFDVIEAFQTLSSEFPQWHLYIAGEGPDREHLEKDANNKGLSDRVSFLGFVADPRTLFEQADIFILASYADPGSLSIGEARVAGCCIVATSVGGTTEMLDYGKSGRLVSPGAPHEITTELRQLMEDPAAREALSRNALEGAERFEVSALVPRYADVYVQVCPQLAGRLPSSPRP